MLLDHDHDHDHGMANPSAGHLTAGGFRAPIARLPAAGLLADACRVCAQHIAPHGNPPHPVGAVEAAAHGDEVPFDGKGVEI